MQLASVIAGRELSIGSLGCRQRRILRDRDERSQGVLRCVNAAEQFFRELDRAQPPTA
jgi:hypothetical protein